MAKGVFHRAGVAIVLIATLLLPFGTCQPGARRASHDCCSHAAPVASLKADCCIVRSEMPAVVAERAAVDPVALYSAAPVLLASGPVIAIPSGFSVTLAEDSPPPGKFILRI